MCSTKLHIGIYSSWLFCTDSFSIYAFLLRESLVGFVRLTQEVGNADSWLFQRKKSIETY